MRDEMNLRERFLATFRFEPCPRTPRWELGYWSGAIQRWYDEGLPGTQQAERAPEAPAAWVRGNGQAGLPNERSIDRDVMNYFQLDGRAERVPLDDHLPVPAYETVVLEETDEYAVVRGSNGVTTRQLRPARGMPEWIDYPVRNRKEWERYKADRFRPDLASRLSPDWQRSLQRYEDRTFPLAIGGTHSGFFGMTRGLLGLEKTLTTFHDDPVWMHDIMDYLAEFYVTLYDGVLSQVAVDYASLWEDMCYVAGPLISPRTFREFMLGPYNKVTGLLRDHGVDVIVVDTDGDARLLISLFQEGGVTALYPFEVNSHMDVAEIRQEYPRLGMMGGIDKKAVAAGKEAIDRELEARVPVVLTGGYIPHIDHGVPNDVSWENFRYYRTRLEAMLDEYDARRWMETENAHP